MTRKILILLVVLIPFLGFSKSKHGKVILIGIDAMSTDGFQTAHVPNMMELVRSGAISITTRGVMPTVSSPNWEAILTGAGPEQNGVTKNGWTLTNRTIMPTVSDNDGYFPSIFTVIRQQMPEAKTSMFYDWPDLGNLINKKDLSEIGLKSGTDEVYDAAISYITKEKPDLAFVFTKHVDQTGHEKGHGTPEYYKSIEDVDQAVGRLIDGMKNSGIYNDYTILVVVDHGGIGFGHGGENMIEIEVPWIISGPGIIKNRVISQPNNSFNTSPTIAVIMGVTPPEAWIGKVATGAFEGTAAAKQNTRIFVPRPSSSVKSGIYTGDQTLTLSSNLNGVKIQYIKQGQADETAWQAYTGPLLIDHSTQVRAKTVMNGIESNELVLDIIKINGIRDVKLKDPPSTRYPAKGPLSLVDGVHGTPDYHDPAWMGFQGNDLDAVIDFGSPRKISHLAVSCLSHEDSWIFLPEKVEFYKSDDGINFTLISKGADKSMSMAREGIHSYSADFTTIETRYLRVLVKNTGVCPEGHPGHGEKAWLFVDEISIE